MSKGKIKFIADLREFATTLTEYVSTNGGDWSIKSSRVWPLFPQSNPKASKQSSWIG